MDTPVTNNELPDFSQFVQRLDGRGENMSADQSVVAFRHYQQQLAQLKAEIQPAIDELDAGLGKELDMNSIIDRVKSDLAKEGIVD
ncbi:MAG: hypothetical protein ACKVH8_17595 [Pirellulales bacterium]|jgi:hypothetical protein